MHQSGYLSAEREQQSKHELWEVEMSILLFEKDVVERER